MWQINWSGFTWNVRDDHEHAYGPGPNYFNPGCIWQDGNKLHFYIKQDLLGRWQCSEIVSQSKFGFGTYEVRIEGCIIDGKQYGAHKIDKNAVFSPFLYPNKEDGPDGTHEIDFPEISRWGNDSYDRVINYSKYPPSLKSDTNNLAGQEIHQYSIPCPDSNNPQVHRLIRKKDSLIFQLIDGNTGSIAIEDTRDKQTPNDISQIPLPMHMNLWLNKSLPPSDGKPVEVIVSKFSFTPET